MSDGDGSDGDEMDISNQENIPKRRRDCALYRTMEKLGARVQEIHLITLKDFQNAQKSGNNPYISITNLKAFEIPLPSIDQQKSIVEKIEDIRNLTKSVKQQVESQVKDLQKLKSSILDSAFKGEL